MERQTLDEGIAMHRASSQQGFSLVETVVSLGVLTVGLLGAAAVMTTGMQRLSTSPADVIVTQKAAQAIEAVFSARDSHRLVWAQIRNVHGASGSDGGVFVDGPTSLLLPGPDGLVNTVDDDTTIEFETLPGKDQLLFTADDQVVTLNAFTREIMIRDVVNENGELRQITVTIVYQSGSTKRTYVLQSFISAYS
jgi:type II secretory pathway pseudopilin PulG